MASHLALSLIQPWAWAVIHAGKDVENRVWWTSIRGPIWIASSAQVTRRYYEQAREIIEAIAGVDVPPLNELTYGAIVGHATIVDCILPGGYQVTSERQARAARLNQALGAQRPPGPRHPLHPHRWHFLDQYGYVLEGVRSVTPVPCKGHQRWWKVPAPVLEQLQRSEPQRAHG